MRGAVIRLIESPIYFGIIPAHAGSSHYFSYEEDGRRDHPRACGEQVIGISDRLPYSGSSPRMRGAALPPIRCV